MDIMDCFARAITLLLGRLAFGALHLFEKLGVDMASVDQALADWTQYATDLKASNADLTQKLQDALDTVQQLKDTDAAEDAAQAEQLTASIGDQIEAALELVKNPPAPPSDGGGEEPPVEEPPVDEGTGQ